MPVEDGRYRQMEGRQGTPSQRPRSSERESPVGGGGGGRRGRSGIYGRQGMALSVSIIMSLSYLLFNAGYIYNTSPYIYRSLG